MQTCPECDGDVEEIGDGYECLDCGSIFSSDSTYDDYEIVDSAFDLENEDEYDEEY